MTYIVLILIVCIGGASIAIFFAEVLELLIKSHAKAFTFSLHTNFILKNLHSLRNLPKHPMHDLWGLLAGFISVL